ncbi:MAG TPA: hypothetical protein VEQ60_02635 [Longimicrobium sp.]|nr:hypothetical protein [Longimicrobium sp.]
MPYITTMSAAEAAVDAISALGRCGAGAGQTVLRCRRPGRMASWSE